MRGSPRPRPPYGEVARRAVGVLTACIVLAPYPTVWVGYRQALHIQAVLVLLATLAILAAGVLRRPRPAMPLRGIRLPLLGCALYALAAVLGAAVGLWRGNAPAQLAGQVLSMGLLPLGFAAGLAEGPRPGDPPASPVADGLVAGTALAAALHLGAWLAGAVEGGGASRLLFENAVSVVAPSLPAFLLALGLAASGSAVRRRGGQVAAALVVAYALGSGVRSLWIVLAFGALGYGVLRRGPRGALLSGHALAAALGLAALAGALWAGTAWLRVERPNLLPPDDPAGPVASQPFPVRPGMAYRAVVCFDAAPRGAGRFGLEWLGEGDGPVGSALHAVPERAGAGCRVTAAGAPDGAAAARLVLPTGGGGAWRVSAARAEELGPAPVSAVAHQLDYAARRIASIPAVLLDPERRAEEADTLDFRVRESTRLLALHRRAAAPAKLLGHGLGATFPLDTWGYDNRGNWIRYGETHYIHDFYLFLLYKLGWVGSGLVAAALVLWLVFLTAAARRCRGSAVAPLLASVAAAFLAAALWSVSSPVFLNFRTAPLWGLLLAAAALRSAPAADPAGDGAAHGG